MTPIQWLDPRKGTDIMLAEICASQKGFEGEVSVFAKATHQDRSAGYYHGNGKEERQCLRGILALSPTHGIHLACQTALSPRSPVLILTAVSTSET